MQLHDLFLQMTDKLLLLAIHQAERTSIRTLQYSQAQFAIQGRRYDCMGRPSVIQAPDNIVVNPHQLVLCCRGTSGQVPFVHPTGHRTGLLASVQIQQMGASQNPNCILCTPFRTNFSVLGRTAAICIGTSV